MGHGVGSAPWAQDRRQRTNDVGVATILCPFGMRFHINRMSHSHEGRSTLHVYTAEGREGG